MIVSGAGGLGVHTANNPTGGVSDLRLSRSTAIVGPMQRGRGGGATPSPPGQGASRLSFIERSERLFTKGSFKGVDYLSADKNVNTKKGAPPYTNKAVKICWVFVYILVIFACKR